MIAIYLDPYQWGWFSPNLSGSSGPQTVLVPLPDTGYPTFVMDLPIDTQWTRLHAKKRAAQEYTSGVRMESTRTRIDSRLHELEVLHAYKCILGLSRPWWKNYLFFRPALHYYSLSSSVPLWNPRILSASGDPAAGMSLRRETVTGEIPSRCARANTTSISTISIIPCLCGGYWMLTFEGPSSRFYRKTINNLVEHSTLDNCITYLGRRNIHKGWWKRLKKRKLDNINFWKCGRCEFAVPM